MKACKLKNNFGQSMIEFAILLPLLIALLAATFEFSQLFIKNMRASSLCREAALIVQRECVTIAPSREETPEDCLIRVRTDMLARAAYVLPEFSQRGAIILSLYGASTASVGGGGTYATQYNSGNIDVDILNTLGTVVISEFYYQNELMTPLEKFIDFVMPRVIYKSTVT